MVTGNILVFISLGLLAYSVSALLRAISKDLFKGMVAVAFFCAICLLGLQLWLMGVLGIPWILPTLLLPWTAIGLWKRREYLAVASRDSRHIWRMVQGARGMSNFEMLLVFSCLVFISAFFVMLFMQPIAGWDAIALWGLKAKVFYHLNKVDLSMVKIPGANNDYPPLYPLIIDVLFVLRGGINNYLVQVVNFLFYINAIWAIAEFFNGKLNKEGRIIFCTIFAGCLNFFPVLFFPSQMGYADFTLGVGMMMALIVLYKAITLKRSKYFVLAIAMAALCSVIKNEGQLFLLTTLIIGIVYNWRLLMTYLQRKQWSKLFLMLALVFLILTPAIGWKAYISINNYRTVLTTQGTTSSISVHEVMYKMRRTIHWYVQFGVQQTGNFIVVGALGVIIIGSLITIKRSSVVLVLSLPILVQVTLSLFVYLVLTPIEINGLLISTLERLIIQLTPAIILLFGLFWYGLRQNQGRLVG